VLQRDAPDTAGTGTIRAHLASIATAFAEGNFELPGFVHGETVPGTAVMTARRSAITYTMDTLPRGGEVMIATSDSTAIAAVHEFLAYQRHAHHAMAHDTDGVPAGQMPGAFARIEDEAAAAAIDPALVGVPVQSHSALRQWCACEVARVVDHDEAPLGRSEVESIEKCEHRVRSPTAPGGS